MLSWRAGVATLMFLACSATPFLADTGLILRPLTDEFPVRSTGRQSETYRASSAKDEIKRAETAHGSVDEMLVATIGRRQHWTRAPELVVLTSVMEYQAHSQTSYVATDIPLSPVEATALVADLTAALTALTDSRFAAFAAISYEHIPAGTSTRIARPGQIVVGRYRGVRALANEIGVGGRSSRPDGTITSGAILLDSDYDRDDSRRRLLRTHELGHALGYNHVSSRPSIMNPKIGSDITETDRVAAAMGVTLARP